MIHHTHTRHRSKGSTRIRRRCRKAADIRHLAEVFYGRKTQQQEQAQ